MLKTGKNASTVTRTITIGSTYIWCVLIVKHLCFSLLQNIIKSSKAKFKNGMQSNSDEMKIRIITAPVEMMSRFGYYKSLVFVKKKR